jgi:hypothetical protein
LHPEPLASEARVLQSKGVVVAILLLLFRFSEARSSKPRPSN